MSIKRIKSAARAVASTVSQAVKETIALSPEQQQLQERAVDYVQRLYAKMKDAAGTVGLTVDDGWALADQAPPEEKLRILASMADEPSVAASATLHTMDYAIDPSDLLEPMDENGDIKA